MSIKLIAIAFLFVLISCKSNKANDPTTAGTETSSKSSTDIAAEKDALNKQSLACIARMNELDAKKKAAQASGDVAAAKAYAASIDSAALENAKIGQKLMDLDK